jgi:NAD(P)-dependent dehydrogenase (short-subunit alcohol dehydrogenase family)
VIVVTGAGGGLGRSHALELARRGASIVVNDLMRGPGESGPGADAVVQEIRDAGGTALASYETVATPDGGQALIDAALKAFGSVDGVIHNAGTWRNVPFEQMTAQNLDHVLDVHLRGAFFVLRPAWEGMLARGYGRIVLTSSGAGVFGRMHGANYVVAKAGLLGLARALSLEGREHGILANSILPLARTEKNSTYLADAKLNEPERVSPLVAYLMSRECAVSGEAFSVGLAGHVARVFVGVTSGWSTGEVILTAEDVAAHLDEIEDRTQYTVPGSVFEQMGQLSDGVAAEVTP